MSTALKIMTLNIETDRHFDRFIPYILDQNPDIVLLQEVLEKDLFYLEQALGMKSQYAPLNYLQREYDTSILGIATFSAVSFVKSYSQYYRGNEVNLPLIRHGEAEKMSRAILVTELLKENLSYCLINTHFTWTPNGQPSPYQHVDVNVLLQFLSTISEFTLCGDFNAPRGGVIFDAIAAQYKDNIPPDISTTLDKNLHKAGDLNFVVDGVFTSPRYQVKSIEVVNGLSDHCGILATIQKN